MHFASAMDVKSGFHIARFRWFTVGVLPAYSKNTKKFHIGIAPDDYERLYYHSQRLGCDMTEIVRHGMFDRLNMLDEQERSAREAKALRDKEKRGARIGSLPKMSLPEGLGITVGKKEKKDEFPKKVLDAFGKHAKYVEEAEDDLEYAIRLDSIMANIKSKCSEAESNVAFVAFKDFLNERKVALRSSKVFPIPEGIAVAGDVDD
jgi:hypothetical protein